jgi:carboxyl-terminal processing protease
MNTGQTNQNGRTRQRHARTFAVSLMIVVALFAGMGLDRVLVVTGIAQTSLARLDEFETLEETYEIIRQYYVLQDDFTDQELLHGASRGMVEALGDTNHSVFLDPDEAYSYETSLQGGLVGIGVTVDTTGELPVIIAPMKGSPALEAGILPGDTIVAIDGVSLEGMEAGDAVDRIRGEAGSDVVLDLIHEGETEPYSVTITRQEIALNPVSWAMLPDGVMWLQLDQFSRGSADQVTEALREAKAMGMTRIMLDLRGNTGGYTNETRAIASLFLPADTPVYQELDADGNVTEHDTASEDGPYVTEPMVVLVDETSASASEVLSSALRDSGRAPLFGQTTVGVGTVTIPIDLSDGSVVIIGIELLLTGEGESFFQIGIEPTNPVELAEGQSRSLLIILDPQDTRQISSADFEAVEDDQIQSAFEAVTTTTP